MIFLEIWGKSLNPNLFSTDSTIAALILLLVLSLPCLASAIAASTNLPVSPLLDSTAAAVDGGRGRVERVGGGGGGIGLGKEEARHTNMLTENLIGKRRSKLHRITTYSSHDRIGSNGFVSTGSMQP